MTTHPRIDIAHHAAAPRRHGPRRGAHPARRPAACPRQDARLDRQRLRLLLVAIAAIDFWTRVAISARTTPASYGASLDEAA
jgi:hypothetical protein